MALSVLLQENVTAHYACGYLLMLWRTYCWAFPSMSRLAYNLADCVRGEVTLPGISIDFSGVSHIGENLWLRGQAENSFLEVVRMSGTLILQSQFLSYLCLLERRRTWMLICPTKSSAALIKNSLHLERYKEELAADGGWGISSWWFPSQAWCPVLMLTLNGLILALPAGDFLKQPLSFWILVKQLFCERWNGGGVAWLKNYTELVLKKECFSKLLRQKVFSMVSLKHLLFLFFFSFFI